MCVWLFLVAFCFTSLLTLMKLAAGLCAKDKKREEVFSRLWRGQLSCLFLFCFVVSFFLARLHLLEWKTKGARWTVEGKKNIIITDPTSSQLFLLSGSPAADLNSRLRRFLCHFFFFLQLRIQDQQQEENKEQQQPLPPPPLLLHHHLPGFCGVIALLPHEHTEVKSN